MSTKRPRRQIIRRLTEEEHGLVLAALRWYQYSRSRVRDSVDRKHLREIESEIGGGEEFDNGAIDEFCDRFN